MNLISFEELQNLYNDNYNKQKNFIPNNNFLFSKMREYENNITLKKLSDLRKTYKLAISEFNFHLLNGWSEKEGVVGDDSDITGIHNKEVAELVKDTIKEYNKKVPLVKYKILIKMNEIYNDINTLYERLKAEAVINNKKNNTEYLKKKVLCDCGVSVCNGFMKRHIETDKHRLVYFERRNKQMELNCQEELREREAEESETEEQE
mgnify:CR=1 FL=1